MRRSSRKRARAGVATVEAVIALPCLALIMIGLLHVAQTAHRKQQLSATTRHCAWRFALTGCQGKSSLPPACQTEATRPSSPGDAEAWLGDEVDGDVLARALQEPELDAPLGLLLEQLVGRNVWVRGVETRPRPLLLGGGELTISAETTLLCNTVPLEAELLDTLFDSYWQRATAE